MPRWTCPRCDRSFGRRNQSHGCEPAITPAAYFRDRPPEQRLTYEAIASHLREDGPVEIEALGIGMRFKRATTFAELRGKRDKMALWFMLSRGIEDPRIKKRVQASTNRVVHFVDLHSADEVDEQIKQWMSEAYFEAPD